MKSNKMTPLIVYGISDGSYTLKNMIANMVSQKPKWQIEKHVLVIFLSFSDYRDQSCD